MRLRAALLAALTLGCASAWGATLPLQTCRLTGLAHDAQCGTLRRPLDPARPDGPQIDLHVVVVPALARQKLPDPVFFFAGGPGQSAITLAGTVEQLTSRLAARRDLVLIDQRGTGHSAPLQCDIPAPDEGLKRTLDRSRQLAALDACRARLEKLPWGDLRFYTTSIAMADADAVRTALGFERINLIGISYGTRAALEYLRAYPSHVRRAVLDGVAPPDMVLPDTDDVDAQAAMEALLRDCAAEKACAAAHPDLARHWDALLASLPRPVDAIDPVTGQSLHIDLTRDALRSLVHQPLYAPTQGALLPYAIDEAAAGRFDVLFALTASVGERPIDLSEGQHLSVICAEDAPRMSAARPPEGGSHRSREAEGSLVNAARPPEGGSHRSREAKGSLVRPVADAAGEEGARGLYRAACARWPRGEVAAAFYTIPPSAAPVLLLSGGIDPVTPPRHAERVARALGPKARTVVVANSGHNVMAIACMRDAVFRWLDAATDAQAQAVAMDCAAKLPRPLAFHPPLPARAVPAANDPGSPAMKVAP